MDNCEYSQVTTQIKTRRVMLKAICNLFSTARRTKERALDTLAISGVETMLEVIDCSW